jgi:autotransporter adhesin
VNGNHNTALGYLAGNNVSVNGATSLGYLASASVADSVALGSNTSTSGVATSFTGGMTAVTASTIAGYTYNYLGGQTVPVGVVSVGNDGGAVRRIQNVATGQVSINSTDAVNGSQLYAVAEQAAHNLPSNYLNVNSTVTGAGSNTKDDSGATGTGAIAVGASATASGVNGVAIGTGAKASTGSSAIAIGLNAVASSPTAVGDALAFGTEAQATGQDATSVGGRSSAGGKSALAVGSSVQAIGDFSIALGYGAVASQNNDISLGGGAAASGGDSIAFGRAAIASSEGGAAIGAGARSLADSAVAIGIGAEAADAGSVALGSGSTTAPPHSGNYVIAGSATAAAGAASLRVVSIGVAGAERQIQNVGAGVLSATSTDAVNGSQLYATNQRVVTNATNIAGLGVRVTSAEETISANASNIASIQQDALHWDSALGAYDASHGSGSPKKITNLAAGSNDADAVNFLQLKSVSTQVNSLDDSAAKYDDTMKGRITLAGTRGTEITNLKPGNIAVASSDAVNGAQLYGASRSIAESLGGSAVVASDGKITGVAYTVQGRSYATVYDSFSAVDASLTSLSSTMSAIDSGGGTKYFHANSSAAGSLAAGTDSVAIGALSVASGEGSFAAGSGATAIADRAIALGKGATAANTNDVALGAGSVTQLAVGTSSATIRGKVYGFAGASPVGTVSIGGVGAERTITNVAAGRISAGSTDGVNGSQLYATNTAIEDLESGIGLLDAKAVKYDLNPDGSKKNKITLIGGDPNAPVLIANVAAGVARNDVVNYGQLTDALGAGASQSKSYTDNKVNWGVDQSKGYTDQVAGNTLARANNYTDARFAQLNRQIGGVQREAHQAAAIGLAAASLRYDNTPGKLSLALGGGFWRDEGAMALGAGFTSPDGRIRANLTATTAGDNWGAGAGLSFTLN